MEYLVYMTFHSVENARIVYDVGVFLFAEEGLGAWLVRSWEWRWWICADTCCSGLPVQVISWPEQTPANVSRDICNPQLRAIIKDKKSETVDKLVDDWGGRAWPFPTIGGLIWYLLQTEVHKRKWHLPHVPRPVFDHAPDRFVWSTCRATTFIFPVVLGTLSCNCFYASLIFQQELV